MIKTEKEKTKPKNKQTIKTKQNTVGNKLGVIIVWEIFLFKIH